MIGAFAQMHQHHVQMHASRLTEIVHHLDVLQQNIFVPLALHLRQPDKNFDLFLWQQRLLHFRFDATQHERLQNAVQSLYDRIVVFATERFIRIEPAVIIEQLENFIVFRVHMCNNPIIRTMYRNRPSC